MIPRNRLTGLEEVARASGAAIEAIGLVDMLLNNASLALLEPVPGVTVEKWHARIKGSLTAVRMLPV
ncbi:MAG: hypothetical protein WA990_04760 [Rubrobacteraceae bacterium]